MAIGACSKASLLNEFRDNNTQAITAASMRLMVNCVYDNFLDKENIIDDLNSYFSDKVLSAKQGAILNDKIEQMSLEIANLDSEKVDINNVYTKAVSDTRYYTQSYIDTEIYTKQDVYDKTQIDNAIFTIQQQIEQLNNRIDNIVQKNNLIE